MTNPAPPLAATAFRKSSFSGDGSQDTCVYLANLRGLATVEIRDSKQGLDLPGFTVNTKAFHTFIASISANEETTH